MPWGPWIQLENKRVGKWIGATEQGRSFGGAVDESATPLLTEDDLDDAWSQDIRSRLYVRHSGATNVDAAAELAARTDAINGDNLARLDVNTDSATAVERANVFPGSSIDRRAEFEDAAVIASGLAYINEPDAFHWIAEYPGYMGQPMQYHPDDIPADGVHGDYGEVFDQWVTLAWNVGLAEAESFYDDTPQIQVATIDPTTVAQPGVDTGYAFTVDAWPDDLTLSASSIESGVPVPAATLGGFGFIGPYYVSGRDAALMDRGADSTLPYLIETSALTDWSWDVDGSTIREARFPLFLRVITDFYYRPARFRLWIESTVVPPLRQFPRDDSLAVGTPRLWPPPQSQQHSPARLDGYV